MAVAERAVIVTRPCSRASRAGGAAHVALARAAERDRARVGLVAAPHLQAHGALACRSHGDRDAVGDGLRAGVDLQRQRRPRAVDLGVCVLVAAREVGAFGGDEKYASPEPRSGTTSRTVRCSPTASGASGQYCSRGSSSWPPEKNGRCSPTQAGVHVPRPGLGRRSAFSCGRSAVRGPAFSTVMSNARRCPLEALRGRGGAQVRAVLGLIAGAVAVDVGLGDRLDRQLRPRWTSVAVRRSGIAAPSGGR